MSSAAQKHSHKNTKPLDLIGLSLSSLCLVHCLGLPFLVSLIPAFASVEDNPIFHIILTLLIVPLGIWAFRSGYKAHKNKSIFWSGLTSLSLLSTATLLEFPLFATNGTGAPHSTVSSALTILASITLVIAHYKNWKESRCRVCSP